MTGQRDRSGGRSTSRRQIRRIGLGDKSGGQFRGTVQGDRSGGQVSGIGLGDREAVRAQVRGRGGVG